MPNILELKNIHQTYKNEEGVNKPVLDDAAGRNLSCDFRNERLRENYTLQDYGRH